MQDWSGRSSQPTGGVLEKPGGWLPGRPAAQTGAPRSARRRLPTRDVEHKMAAIRAAITHEFPTADMSQILADTERGHLGGDSR